MFLELNIFEKINEEINVMMEYKYSFFIQNYMNVNKLKVNQ